MHEFTTIIPDRIRIVDGHHESLICFPLWRVDEHGIKARRQKFAGLREVSLCDIVLSGVEVEGQCVAG
jgi:hypothetical protein